jgi:ethanolamine utilization protein EutN
MQIARVLGHAVSTIKHSSLIGWRLVLVQPLAPDEKPDGEPLLAIDRLGSAASDRVIISNDGNAAREMVGARNSPARWFILGIQDAHR